MNVTYKHRGQSPYTSLYRVFGNFIIFFDRFTDELAGILISINYFNIKATVFVLNMKLFLRVIQYIFYRLKNFLTRSVFFLY